MAFSHLGDNFKQGRGSLCRIFECRDHACGALADDDGGAAADDVDAVFALPHVIVARVGGIAHEGALAPLPHRSIFRRISAEHAAVSPLRGPADRSPAQCGVRPHRGSFLRLNETQHAQCSIEHVRIMTYSSRQIKRKE